MAGPDMHPCYVVVKIGQKCKGVSAVGAGEVGLVGKLGQGRDCWTGVDEWQHWVNRGGSWAGDH